MRVRHIIIEKKELQSDSDWRVDDLTRKNAPIYSKTKPIPSGWKWRSAKATGESGEYVLLGLCNPNRDKWQAILMKLADDGGASAVGRFEHHGSHPGLHVHAHCQRSGIEQGAGSLNDLTRFPKSGSDSYHRRKNAWTERGFWEAAKRFFRIEEQKGSLL